MIKKRRQTKVKLVKMLIRVNAKTKAKIVKRARKLETSQQRLVSSALDKAF